jgi:hypothetical protein
VSDHECRMRISTWYNLNCVRQGCCELGVWGAEHERSASALRHLRVSQWCGLAWGGGGQELVGNSLRQMSQNSRRDMVELELGVVERRVFNADPDPH